MSGNSLSRREFIAAGLSGTAAASLAPTAAPASPSPAATSPAASEAQPPIALTNPGPGAWARWLDGNAPAINTGVTRGVPWTRGKHGGPKFAAGREANKNTAGHFALR